MFKVERQADVREARLVTALRKPGSVYIKIAPPTRRRAKAERIAINARTDWQTGDQRIRVRS